MKFSQEEKDLRKFLYYKRHLYWQVRKLEVLGVPNSFTETMFDGLALLEQYAIGKWPCYCRETTKEIEEGVDEKYRNLQNPSEYIRDHRWTLNIASDKVGTMKSLMEIQGELHQWYVQIAKSFPEQRVINFLNYLMDSSMNLAIWYGEQAKQNSCSLGKTIDTLLKDSSLNE